MLLPFAGRLCFPNLKALNQKVKHQFSELTKYFLPVKNLKPAAQVKFAIFHQKNAWFDITQSDDYPQRKP